MACRDDQWELNLSWNLDCVVVTILTATAPYGQSSTPILWTKDWTASVLCAHCQETGIEPYRRVLTREVTCALSRDVSCTCKNRPDTSRFHPYTSHTPYSSERAIISIRVWLSMTATGSMCPAHAVSVVGESV